jgi:hypothetical protein
MFPDPSFTLADQLYWAVQNFRAPMGAEAWRRRIGLFSIALWQRLRGFERRFATLYAQWKAGVLPKARVRVVKNLNRGGRRERGEAPRDGEGRFDPLATDADSSLRAIKRPASVLPRGFAWLHRMLPESAPPLTGGVDSLVRNYPEIQVFAAECPQVKRILRPLCRMVGVKAPEWLAAPRRRTAVVHPSPNPSLKGRGMRKRRTAREIAAAAIEKALRTGKPVDPTKMSSVAFGYVLHWPRDGNCPPPEIGYGGKAFPRTPKDYVPPRD